MRSSLVRLARHPAVGVVAGVTLVIGGTIDLLEDLFESFETVFEFYHSGIVLGVFLAFRGLAEMAEGVSWLAIKEELEDEAEAREAAGVGKETP